MGFFKNRRLKRAEERRKAEDERRIAELTEQIKDSDIVNAIYGRFYQWAQDYFIPLWKKNSGKNYHDFQIRVWESSVAITEYNDSLEYSSTIATIYKFSEHGYKDIEDRCKRAALSNAICLKPGLDRNGYMDVKFWAPIMNKYCEHFKDIF